MKLKTKKNSGSNEKDHTNKFVSISKIHMKPSHRLKSGVSDKETSKDKKELIKGLFIILLFIVACIFTFWIPYEYLFDPGDMQNKGHKALNDFCINKGHSFVIDCTGHKGVGSISGCLRSFGLGANININANLGLDITCNDNKTYKSVEFEVFSICEESDVWQNCIKIVRGFN